MIGAGAIPVLIEAMSNFVKVGAIQEQCCAALKFCVNINSTSLSGGVRPLPSGEGGGCVL